MLHARNVPFLPGAFRPGPDEASQWVSLDFSDAGGHVGFVTGPFPGSLGWLPGRLLDFFASQLRGGVAGAIHGR